jgi:hypothetical protein
MMMNFWYLLYLIDELYYQDDLMQLLVLLKVSMKLIYQPLMELTKNQMQIVLDLLENF